ncbi:hypothetical protein [Nocardia xishanensis]|uniref:hypothetical protein n=1 Tax=Nocardia xishanensis TaxID=238964 RepID=UPI0033FE0D61
MIDERRRAGHSECVDHDIARAYEHTATVGQERVAGGHGAGQQMARLVERSHTPGMNRVRTSLRSVKKLTHESSENRANDFAEEKVMRIATRLPSEHALTAENADKITNTRKPKKSRTYVDRGGRS